MPVELKFCFEFDAVANIEPWGEPGRAKLHWFGLTSGRYWIETPVGEVLRYTNEILAVKGWPSCHVDYQVARMFEDLQQCLPSVLEAVPLDIAQIVAQPGWPDRVTAFIEEGEERENKWDLIEAALDWWQDRHIDTLHLKHGQNFHLWRTDDEVHVQWETMDNYDGSTPVFLVPKGCVNIGVVQFRDAAYGFCEAVLGEMRGRVDAIKRNGWLRADCSLDVEHLADEQTRREQAFLEVRNRIIATEWTNVRAQLMELVEQIGRAERVGMNERGRGDIGPV